jgi:hypothetical protein
MMARAGKLKLVPSEGRIRPGSAIMEEPKHDEVTQAVATPAFDGSSTPSPTECASGAPPGQSVPGLERLRRAGFVPPSTIELEFVDGLRSLLAIDLLGMPVDRINWMTVTASPAGDKMTVNGIKGDAIPIDSATLRYLVDEKYAAKMDQTLKSLQFSRDELAELARDNPPPSWWYDEPEQDMTRESWK